jgi:hypothetical protein
VVAHPGAKLGQPPGGFYEYFRPEPNTITEPPSAESQTLGQLGVVSLTTILIGLIVTWMGYFKTVRWTWFVMFALVFGWAYPILRIRVFIFNLSLGWIAGLVRDAVHSTDPHLPRTLLRMMLIFVLMLIALILPIRSFPKGSTRRPRQSSLGLLPQGFFCLFAVSALCWRYISISLIRVERLTLLCSDRVNAPSPGLCRWAFSSGIEGGA